MEKVFIRSENEESPIPNNIKYPQAIGALLYIATITRPDMLLAVNFIRGKMKHHKKKIRRVSND